MRTLILTLTLIVPLWPVLPARAGEEPAKPETKKAKAAVITLKGTLPETPGQVGLFAELEQNLAQFLERFDRAAGDKDIAAVIVEVRNPSIGRGKVEELRAAIRRLREIGKPVIAELETGTSVDYLIAAACDQIVMPESGVLMIPGVRAEVTHFKGLLDRLGIEADMMQMGDFKGAAEPFTRTEMSPEYRQQLESVIDDIYRQLVDTMAADRKLDAAKIRALIDQGLITPVEAHQAGLIDGVVYREGLRSQLQKKLAVDELTFVENYAKRKVEDDFSGMLGMIRLFELMMGVDRSKRSSSAKKVAVIYASGMIMPGKSSAGLLGETMGSDTLVKAINKAAQDKTVIALVLRVDSPGGSALASDLIWQAIRRCDKPVVASMGDTAASGGYYISMGCDKIFAEAGTLTGSIGVVGGKLALGGMFQKIGVHTDIISRGQNSGLLTTESRFSDSERAAWKKMMEEIYRQFVSKAAEGRKMSVEELTQLAGGRIWTGCQAQEKRLVDEVGTLKDAIAEAKKLAGIPADEKVELLTLPEPVNIFEQLFGGDVSLRASDLTRVLSLPPEVAGALRQAEAWSRLLAEPVLLASPYHITIR